MSTANLRTKIPDFRGFDSSIVLIIKGWNSEIHGELSEKFESTILSRDNSSREIGRIDGVRRGAEAAGSGMPVRSECKRARCMRRGHRGGSRILLLSLLLLRLQLLLYIYVVYTHNDNNNNDKYYDYSQYCVILNANSI